MQTVYPGDDDENAAELTRGCRRREKKKKRFSEIINRQRFGLSLTCEEKKKNKKQSEADKYSDL